MRSMKFAAVGLSIAASFVGTGAAQADAAVGPDSEDQYFTDEHYFSHPTEYLMVYPIYTSDKLTGVNFDNRSGLPISNIAYKCYFLTPGGDLLGSTGATLAIAMMARTSIEFMYDEPVPLDRGTRVVYCRATGAFVAPPLTKGSK